MTCVCKQDDRGNVIETCGAHEAHFRERLQTCLKNANDLHRTKISQVESERDHALIALGRIGLAQCQ